MERGKFLKGNLKKLESTTDSELIAGLKKCKDHVVTRLRKRTIFGAHNEERLGMDPIDYYVSYAYDAILDGNWEWKEGRTFGEQILRIADNRIGKEVDIYKGEINNQFSLSGEDINDFYSDDPTPELPTILQEAVFAKKITIIEDSIKGDENLELFWECVKEGMKRIEIAEFMEKSVKQVDKLRERLIAKLKSSPHFQLG